MINQTDYFPSLNLFSNTFYSGNRARGPNRQTPVKSASRIRYCCNYEKVAYNECQVTLLILQIYSSMSVP